MSGTVKCDNCGITRDVGDSVGWRHVTYESEILYAVTDTRDLDFCSWKCMGEYSQMRERAEESTKS